MDAPLDPAPAGSRWMVLHTRPRCEKKVAEVCAAQGARCYIPLLEKVHTYGSRVRRMTSPLFAGYAFAILDEAQRTFLARNRYTANVLSVDDETRLLAQLRAVRTALDSGSPMEIMPYLDVGNVVRVAHGPLKGMTGRVARIKGQTRIVINIDMIRESVAVEVDSSLLSPA